jgi:hypothetical protein
VELFGLLTLTYEKFFFHFVTSERTLTTLVKENHLSLLRESCSAGLKLVIAKFSSRLVTAKFEM